MRFIRLVMVTTLLSTIGCGDDTGAQADSATPDAANPDAMTPDAGPPVAADYEGLWLITSMTLPSGDGTLVTILRDGDPTSLRGDLVFSAAGADTLNGNVRQTQLVDGLMVTEVFSDDLTVTLDGYRWVLEDPRAVTVYTAALDQDHLVLEYDADDARNTSVDPPTTIIVDRVTPWTTNAVGSWNVVSITPPGSDPTLLGECNETNPGTQWVKIEMTVTVDERLLFNRLLTLTAYSDDACANQTNQQMSPQEGMGEEEGGTTLRIWTVEDGTAEYQAFTMVTAGDQITLTLTECLPAGCEATAPSEVVIQRVP